MNVKNKEKQVLDQPNLNYLWASVLVEELRRQGAEHFFLSPGSRSAPLLSAAGHNKEICSVVHFDERALAFMACGHAAATGRPAVLICTSGTAAANFLPAVIEASKKKLPLVVLTADRPPELQRTGAPQTIEQSGLYDPYVRWSFDMPCPSMEIPLPFVLTTAAQLISRAKGELPGPVHLNVMFREPLSRVKINKGLVRYSVVLNRWAVSGKPYTVYAAKKQVLTEPSVQDALDRLGRINKGIILAGKLSSSEDREAILAFSEKTGFPVFPDVTSGLRLGVKHPHVVSYFDQILAEKNGFSDIDGVVHFGGRMTSKRCYDLLSRVKLKEYVMVLSHPLRSDPLHQVTARFTVSPSIFIDALKGRLPLRSCATLAAYQRANSRAGAVLDRKLIQGGLSEPSVARSVSLLVPEGNGLFLSNSMPVRDMDIFASCDGARVAVGANRGASGIDGIISSAAGFAQGLKMTTTLMIGDLAFLYDLNALALLRSSGIRLIIVVLNNNGGGIFSLLPVATDTAVFEKCFISPHGLSFRAAAELFGLKFAAPTSMADFKRVYRQALKVPCATIIEIKTSRRKSAHPINK